MRTPSLASSRIGASAACGGFGGLTQLVDETAERDARRPPRTGARAPRRAARWRAPARRRCAARSRRARAWRRADPASFRRPDDGCAGGAAAAAARSASARSAPRCASVLGDRSATVGRHAERDGRRRSAVSTRAALRRRSRRARPRSVANTDSSSSGHSMAASAARSVSISSRLVEGPAADQHVRDAARFERVDVRLRRRPAVADEPAEQDADVSRLDADPRCLRALGHRPAALVEQPVDECADGVRQRLLDAGGRELRVPYGSGTGSATIDGLPGRRRPRRRERHILACSVAASPVMTGANAAFTHAWMPGTLRKLVVSVQPAARRTRRSRSQTSGRSRRRRGGSGRSTASDRRR